MTPDIIRGGELVQTTVKILNEICRYDGGIETDDARIWDHWLHTLTNQDWLDMLAAVTAVYEDAPGVFYTADTAVFDRASKDLARSIAKDKDFVGRPKIRASGNKNTAWQTIMRIREVVNRYRGQNIPNRPPSTYGAAKPPPNKAFDDNFTQE